MTMQTMPAAPLTAEGLYAEAAAAANSIAVRGSDPLLMTAPILSWLNKATSPADLNLRVLVVAEHARAARKIKLPIQAYGNPALFVEGLQDRYDWLIAEAGRR